MDFNISGDYMTRSLPLFHVNMDLLKCTDLVEFANGRIQIPFEIPLPPHDEIQPGIGPCAELLLPSMNFTGQSHHYQYSGSVQYCLKATLDESLHSYGDRASFSSLYSLFTPKSQTVSFDLNPFIIHDPRLLPLLLYPDIRRWKSSPENSPIEYDIQVGSIVLGALDDLKLGYRMMVHPDLVCEGVRIQSVSFVLKEIRIVGEDRCCFKDDLNDPFHPPGSRVSGSVELLRWCQPEFESCRDQRGEFTPTISGKSFLDSPQCERNTRDGIYAESETILTIPSIGGFIPTTARPVLSPNDDECAFVRPRKPFIQIKHMIQIFVEFKGHARFALESPIFLIQLGRQEVLQILDRDPEIVPTLDYDKIVGMEEWVPQYSSHPSPVQSCEELTVEVVEEPRLVLLDPNNVPLPSQVFIPGSPTPSYSHIVSPLLASPISEVSTVESEISLESNASEATSAETHTLEANSPEQFITSPRSTQMDKTDEISCIALEHLNIENEISLAMNTQIH